MNILNECVLNLLLQKCLNKIFYNNNNIPGLCEVIGSGIVLLPDGASMVDGLGLDGGTKEDDSVDLAVDVTVVVGILGEVVIVVVVDGVVVVVDGVVVVVVGVVVVVVGVLVVVVDVVVVVVGVLVVVVDVVVVVVGVVVVVVGVVVVVVGVVVVVVSVVVVVLVGVVVNVVDGLVEVVDELETQIPFSILSHPVQKNNA